MDYFLTEFDIYQRDNSAIQGKVLVQFHGREYERDVLNPLLDILNSTFMMTKDSSYTGNVVGFRYYLDPRVFPTDFDGTPSEIITYATVEVNYEVNYN